jgi:hypothetical protein
VSSIGPQDGASGEVPCGAVPNCVPGRVDERNGRDGAERTRLRPNRCANAEQTAKAFPWMFNDSQVIGERTRSVAL